MPTENSAQRRFDTKHVVVRPVSQIQLKLEREAKDPFRSVQQEVLSWIQRKAGKPLPKAAWDGLSFELDDVGAQRVAACHLDDPLYWAARVDDADRYVAQRTWTTEIGLAPTKDGIVTFGCRLIVSARGENPPFQPSIPAFVRDAISGGRAYLDNRVLDTEPWLVRTKEDVGQLYGLMIAKGRRSDLCVFSLAENSEDPLTAAASALAVHNKTLGAAHVVVLSGPAAYMLTDIVGKEFSVFNRAIRTYRPGFDIDSDDPLRHPIAMPHRIAFWRDNSLDGPVAFEAFLSRGAILQTVSYGDIERIQPPFSDVRRAATITRLVQARREGASTEELLRLFEDDNAKLRAALDEEKALHGGLLEEAERERDDAQRRFEEARGEVDSLKSRIRLLEDQLGSTSGSTTQVSIPNDLSSLKDWADQHLSGSVLLHKRALRGAKNLTTNARLWSTLHFYCYEISISRCVKKGVRNLRKPTKPS